MLIAVLPLLLAWLDEEYMSLNGPDKKLIKVLAKVSWGFGKQVLHAYRAWVARCYMQLIMDVRSYGHRLSHRGRQVLHQEIEKLSHRDAECYHILIKMGAVNSTHDVMEVDTDDSSEGGATLVGRVD